MIIIKKSRQINLLLHLIASFVANIINFHYLCTKIYKVLYEKGTFFSLCSTSFQLDLS